MRRLLLMTVATASTAAAVVAPAAVAGPSWKERLETLPPSARVDVVGSGTLTKNVIVRAAPNGTARHVTRLRQFRKDYRPQYVLAVAEKVNPETGRASWYRIVLPGRPNGRTGWIPAASLDLRPVDRWIVIDRDKRIFSFYVRGRLIREGDVAVGAPGMETPRGLFYVTWKFDPTWEVLGAYAFETSAYSKLSEWPGGGIVGVHGTNTPELLGQAVSHGCVRLHNLDINFLRSVVPLGTPVRIIG